MKTSAEIKKLKVAKFKCNKSSLFFTRYFFKKRFNRKFVVSEHHEIICNALDRVVNGDLTRLIINIAPRYGKTELAVKNFIAHSLGLNPKARFIHLSYADDLALDNSEEIKDIVTSEDYQDLYGVKIKKDSKAKKKWYTEEGGGVYATSAGGQVTGFGAGRVDDEDLDFIDNHEFGGAIVIDDPIKPEDADSPIVRDRVNNRFDSTIRNRVNSRNTPIIIIMQRLHENDLCGHLMANEPDKWEVINMPCIKEDGSPLWEFKHTIQELEELKRLNETVFDRQYMQNPINQRNLLYKSFGVYETLPQLNVRKAYVDTADKGEDYTCAIAYGIPQDKEDDFIYVLDILYSQESMEHTEPMTINFLNENNINNVDIESNNGGRGFARVVRKGVSNMSITDFHQSANKEARIMSNSATVNRRLLFPLNWKYRWPDVYEHIRTYKRNFKSNPTDDIEDVMTGVIEKSGKQFWVV